MSWAASAIAAGTIGSSLIGTFGSKKPKQPELTPAQKAAQGSLLNFGTTGVLGDYRAGEAYTGSLGDFSLSAMERSGLDLMSGRLGGSEQIYNDILDTDKYDPLKQGGVYDQLRGRIQRTTREAADAHKRGSAFSGNLYSTDAHKGLADVYSRGAETEAVTMASLFDNYVGRKMSAAPMREEMTRGRLSDAMSYGGLPRTLNTGRDMAKYGEFQRQRGEHASRLDALRGVLGSPNPAPQQQTSNPWAAVLASLGQMGGSYLAGRDTSNKWKMPNMGTGNNTGDPIDSWG
jgi:hypothetical protein